MKNLKLVDLTQREMIQVNGGDKTLGYYLGYAIGYACGEIVTFATGIANAFKH